MKQKNFLITAGSIFGIVSVLHLWRSVLSLPMVVGNWNVPLWISYIAVIVLWIMSYSAFKLAKK